MAWIILIIVAIVGFCIYIAYSEKNKALTTQVDAYGGMMNKYELLVENLLLWPDSRVAQVTRDKITIISAGRGLTAETYVITEGPNYVEIKWELSLATGNKQSKQWRFPHDSSQETMLERIAEDISKTSISR